MPYKNKADEAARSRRYRKAASEATPEDSARTIRRLTEENKSLRAEVTTQTRRADEAEDLRDSAFGLGVERPEPAPWRPKTTMKKPNPRLLPVLFTSDFQCGEVIRPDEIDGLNSYDKDIFAARYCHMIDKTLEWANHHVGKAEFPGVYYLRGGDAISGEIHAELAETNDLGAVPAVKWLHRYEAEGIRRLRDRFGKVRVFSIPGNHGRTTFKPRAKGYVDTNFETLLAWWLEAAFEADPNVEFVTPSSGDAYFDAEGWKVLMSHGDRMGSRGGQGFIGPGATIARGHKKLVAQYGALGKRVDVVLTGHLHTSLQTEDGYANGSVAGYSEYAQSFRAKPSPAMQWLFFFHERYGVAHKTELRLSDIPR